MSDFLEPREEATIAPSDDYSCMTPKCPRQRYPNAATCLTCHLSKKDRHLVRKYPKGQRVRYYDQILAPNKRCGNGTVVGYRAKTVLVYMDDSFQAPFPFKPEALKRLRKKGTVG